MNIWLLILAVGLITYATRLSFIVLLDRMDVPEWFTRALRFVPAAVLSAIIAPELVSYNGALDLSLRNPQLLSGVLAVLVAWRTKSIFLTILAGMAAYLILQAIIK